MADTQSHQARNKNEAGNCFVAGMLFHFFCRGSAALAQGSNERKAPVENKMPEDSIDTSAQETTLGPPSVPVEQIIKQFAAKEAEFKIERDNFTYTQTFVIQTLDDSNRVDGEYRIDQRHRVR